MVLCCLEYPVVQFRFDWIKQEVKSYFKNVAVKENLCFIGTKFPHLDTSVKSLHGFGS